jgi:protein TonB
MRRRLSLWMLASLAIHGVLVAGALALVDTTTPPMLFVDLVQGLLASEQRAPSDRVGRGPAPLPAGSPGPPARAASKPVAPGRAAPSHEALARPPVPASPVTPPSEPVHPQPEPVQPVPAPEPSLAEPVPVLIEPAPPEPRVAPPASPRPAEPAHPSALADGAPRGGAASDAAALTRPADAAGAGVPAASGGPTAAGPSSVGGHGAGAAGTGLGVRDGSVLALAVPGNGDGEGAEYAAYLTLVRRRIHELLAYPSSARRRGLSGTVHLELDIEPSGAIGGVRLAASSSHRVLDDAALDAVRGLRRVAFPPNVRPRALRVRLPIVFELR